MPGWSEDTDSNDLKSLFDANTILKADTDNTPEALTIAEQRLVGRITSGVITALTAAEVKTLLAIDHGTDVTGLGDNDHTQYILHSLAGAANDFLVASGANTYVKKTLAETLAIISPLTTRGDIIYRNATVSTRLAKGADNTIFAMGADDPEWKTPATIMADLSGQAAAAFSFNGQNLTGVNDLNIGNDIFMAQNARLVGGNSDNDGFLFYVRDNGVGLVPVVIFQGAADPYVSFGSGREFKFYYSGTADFGAATLNGTLALNGQVFDAGAGNAQINTTANAGGLILQGSNASGGTMLTFDSIHTTPNLNAEIGKFLFRAFDAAGSPVQQDYGAFFLKHSNIGDGTEEATFDMYMMAGGGANNLAMRLIGTGALWTDLKMETITISLRETTAAPGDTTGEGQFWLKNDAPNVPYFTDDDGRDFPLIGNTHPLANTYSGDPNGTTGSDGALQTVKTVVVPANTLTQTGDRLRIRSFWTGDDGGPITGTTTCNGVAIAAATDGGGASFFTTEAWLHYVDNTHANIIESGAYPATGANSAANVAGFTWDAAQDVDVDQNNVASNHIIVYAIFLDVWPKGYD